MLCLPLKLAFLGLSVAFDTADSVAKHLLDIILGERDEYPVAAYNDEDCEDCCDCSCEEI